MRVSSIVQVSLPACTPRAAIAQALFQFSPGCVPVVAPVKLRQLHIRSAQSTVYNEEGQWVTALQNDEITKIP